MTTPAVSTGSVQCFLLEPTERVSQALRRYSKGEGLTCPNYPGKYSFHTAAVRVEDAPIRLDTSHRHEGVIRNGCDGELEQYADDPRWPTHCACGYAFTEEDARQVFCERLYARADTGEETTLRDAPAGAMWRSPWNANFFTSQDEGAPLCVKLPDGTEWCVDGQANNCTMHDDHRQEQHHCWPRHGVPPNVSVDKDGRTCAAGAGSIASPGYHGFLRNGMLQPA